MVLKSAQDNKNFLDTYNQVQGALYAFQIAASELQKSIISLKASPLYSTVLDASEKADVDAKFSKAVDLVPDISVFFPTTNVSKP